VIIQTVVAMFLLAFCVYPHRLFSKTEVVPDQSALETRSDIAPDGGARSRANQEKIEQDQQKVPVSPIRNSLVGGRFGIQYAWADPNGDMGAFFSGAEGFRARVGGVAMEYRSLFNRFGMGINGVDFTYLRFAPDRPGDRYDLYRFGPSCDIELSILHAGIGFDMEVIDVRIREVGISSVFITYGLFAEAGIRVPLFSERVVLCADALYGLAIPMRGMTREAAPRELYYTMKGSWIFFVGAELRVGGAASSSRRVWN
jgi:hypothetical protein